MIRVEVKADCRVYNFKKKSCQLSKAIQFYCRLLKAPAIFILVAFEKDLHKRRKIVAECEPLNDAYDSFIIRIDSSVRFQRMLIVAAHETVHAVQFAEGRLRMFTDGRATWNGIEHPLKSTIYWDYPWEIEAYGRETGLFVRFVERYRLAGNSWASIV